MHTARSGNEHVLVLEAGERLFETVTDYLSQHTITAARFTAFGAFREVDLRYFNMESKHYEQRVFQQQVEVVSLIGSASLREGKPFIHAHAVVSDQQYHTLGGHLGDAVVDPTLELFLTQLDRVLEREKDPRTGLYLLRPDIASAER